MSKSVNVPVEFDENSRRKGLPDPAAFVRSYTVEVLYAFMLPAGLLVVGEATIRTATEARLLQKKAEE